MTQYCFSDSAGMCSFEQAQGILEQQAGCVVNAEVRALDDCCGAVLAQAVISTRALPAFDNAAMDGFALKGEFLNDEDEVSLSCVASIYAGESRGDNNSARPDLTAAGSSNTLNTQQVCYEIFTGAPLPKGTDTVVAREQVVADQIAAMDSGRIIRFPPGLKKKINVRKRGEDVGLHTEVFQIGHRLRAQDVALLAALGVGQVKVYRRLKVGLFSTGNELLEPCFLAATEASSAAGSSDATGGIFDSNRYLLKSWLAQLPCDVEDFGIVSDDVKELEQVMTRAAASCDLVISSGGASAGAKDFVVDLIKKMGKLYFWKLAIKPGKPLAVGELAETVFVALPGNPVASAVTFLRLAKPLVMQLCGESLGSHGITRAFVKVEAAFTYRKKLGRREWLRATILDTCGIEIRNDADPAQCEAIDAGKAQFPKVRLVDGHSSAMLYSLTQADGLLELPETLEDIEPGDVLDLFLL